MFIGAWCAGFSGIRVLLFVSSSVYGNFVRVHVKSHWLIDSNGECCNTYSKPVIFVARKLEQNNPFGFLRESFA